MKFGNIEITFSYYKKRFYYFYKQNILGPILVYLQPFNNGHVCILLKAKLSTDGLPQVAFYLAGITIWYFSDLN
jgi:lipopolysaccharide transport system permease protein